MNSGGGSNQFVNALYTVAPAPSGTGWRFTSPGSAVVKTITLAGSAEKLVANYSLGGGYDKLFVRFGLSPDPDDLLVRGQRGLSLLSSASVVTLLWMVSVVAFSLAP